MDIKTFEFPEISGLDMAFSCLGTDPTLLAEAKERGFYNGDTDHNALFNDLFFSGGKVEFQKNVDEDFKNKAWPYCRALMGSFEPKHEEKEAICSMLMSELLVAKKKSRKLW